MTLIKAKPTTEHGAHACSRLTLDVDERNHIARAAYRRARFKQIAQSKKLHESGECWGLLRLANPLEATEAGVP